MAIGKKTGGRTRGTPNKDKQVLLDMIQEKHPGWHPLMAMAEIANDKKQEDQLRFQACKEVCKYIVPQLKAVEVKGDAQNPLSLNIVVSSEQHQQILDNL